MRQLDFQLIQLAIIKNIKKYVGDKNVVLGISGGIDSAVTASLCVNALGPEKVIGIMLPYGQQSDIKDSQSIISHLKINFFTVDIKPIVDQYNFSDRLVLANIMARTRMTLLYAYANTQNALVVGTTNKSEFAIGYFTKHGDGACDLEPIAELYKTEVFQLAKYLNIPKNIITKKPTAGLWDGQTDENEFGFTYNDLDKFLQGESVDSDTTIKIKNLIKASEHKRHLPPIIPIK